MHLHLEHHKIYYEAFLKFQTNIFAVWHVFKERTKTFCHKSKTQKAHKILTLVFSTKSSLNIQLNRFSTYSTR